jgi:hypothetical protein
MQKRRTIKLMDFEVRTPKVSKPEFIFKTMRQLQIWGANSCSVSRRAR